MSRIVPAPRTLVCAGGVLAAALTASIAVAQVPEPGTQPLPVQPVPEPDPDPLHPHWTEPPRRAPFNGFPLSFPKGLGAFGSFTQQQIAAGVGMPSVFAMPAEEKPGWPRWLRAIDATPFPYVPEQALLLRQAERVWWKAPGEDAFVPLYFHDKVRSVVVGTEIEVRQTGEFELLLHDSGRIGSAGPARFAVRVMDATRVSIDISVLTKLRLQVSGREHTFRLPDGSSLRVPADVPPATPDTLPLGPAILVIDRVVEPGEFAGRASIFNGGLRPVQWQHAFGTVEIQPGQRSLFFLEPPTTAVPASFASSGVAVEAQGKSCTCVGTGDGKVSWCGAEFKVGQGAKVQFDALLGAPFGGAGSR